MKKKPIPLGREEDALLRSLYSQWRIPRGQFKKHPELLGKFVEKWNLLSGRSDHAHDVLHYIETKQKASGRLPDPWPSFDGAHKRLEPPNVHLSREQWDILADLYEKLVIPLRIGTDKLTYSEELLDSLTSQFSRRARVFVHGLVLASLIEDRRKDNSWVRLRDIGRKNDGFDDLDDLQKQA